MTDPTVPAPVPAPVDKQHAIKALIKLLLEDIAVPVIVQAKKDGKLSFADIFVVLKSDTFRNDIIPTLEDAMDIPVEMSSLTANDGLDLASFILKEVQVVHAALSAQP